MNLKTKMDYEANGIIVKELAAPDPHFRTRTFTQVPGGKLLPYYNAFYEIPNSLNNNDEFDMNYYALPASGRSDCEAIIWDLSPGMEANGSLAVMTMIGLALIILKIVGAIIILYCIYQILNLLFNPHPCGPQGSVESINNSCYVKIIFPDCSWKWFNSCAGPDENGDGIPDGIVEDEGGAPPDYGQLLLYGVLGIGAVVVLMTLMKSRGSEKYYGEHPSERPAPNARLSVT